MIALRWVGPALAATGGVLWALCFHRVPLTLASWLALAPLVLLARHPRGALLGGLYGFSYWMVAIWWIAPTLEVFGGLPSWLGWCLLAVLAGYLALYNLAFGWIVHRLWRRRSWALLLGAPAAWVALEWLRGWLLTGFPWNLAAYAWAEMPGALALTAWVGSWGVSFLLLFANTGIALGWARKRWEPAGAAVLAALCLLAVAARWGGPRSPRAIESASAAGQPVRILQPNIPNLPVYDEQVVFENLEKVLAQSARACADGALLIWPESAAWPFTLEDSPLLRQALDRLTRRGCPVLVNTPMSEAEQDYNSVVLVDRGGPVARYDKRHLVPYGEYVPLKRLFPFIGTVARAAGDFTAADEVRLLPWGREGLGAAICFEVIFPGEVAATVRRGATVLVTVTNDAWYGPTSAPWQHFRAAQFRAAETHRPMLRAAITGVSGSIGPDGEIRSLLGVDRQGVLADEVVGRTGLTPFVRAPWLTPLLSLVILVVALWRSRAR
ncbi:MAG: apolipoprotein N-acyltransferase [Thermoanaerobaculia bacterium]